MQDLVHVPDQTIDAVPNILQLHLLPNRHEYNMYIIYNMHAYTVTPQYYCRTGFNFTLLDT